MTNAPLLQYPDYSKPFILTTDASNVALGAVLSQGQVGCDKPVAYASRTLSDTESRYSTIEKELLAIVWAVKQFRPYLYGRKFLIYTDHRPLAWLNSLKDPSSKLTRWRLRLQDYDFEIIYKNGKQNTNADALSRIKLNALDSDDDSMKVNTDPDYETKIAEIIKDLKSCEKIQNRHDSSTITISDKSATASGTDNSETLSATSTVKHRRDSPLGFPVRSPSNSDNSQTIHSAADLEPIGIPILNEAIDTKPNQILVHHWFKTEFQVKNLSHNKQKILEVFMPIGNDD